MTRVLKLFHFKTTYTSCMDEVRVKVPSFKNSHFFYKIKQSIETLFVYILLVGRCYQLPWSKMAKHQKKLEEFDTSFFLSNDTKTCTTSRLIKGIQLLACKLGTEFAMLFTIYYLLNGSEIFSDVLSL